MFEAKRGPGRPQKVRPEAEVLMEEKPAPAPAVERLVEVEIKRKYAPQGQTTEVCRTVPPGTVLKVTQLEAIRLMKHGVAVPTDSSFD